MLNAASREFIVNPKLKNAPKIPEALKIKINIKKMKAKTRLVRGPAREILPFFSFVIRPLIKTAPGAAIINPKKENKIDNHNIL